jgi:transposase
MDRLRKNKPIRKPLPKDIPRETIVHGINEQEKYCSCGLLLEQIGEEVSEQLDIIPLQLKAIEHVRPKYACRKCQGNIKISNMPKLFLPKSIATAGLAAYIITTKYEDHIPLYRQEKMFKRYGIDLPRSTSCGIVLASSQLCEPLLNCFQENIIRYDYCQVDDTPVQVLKTPNRKNTDKSYMWCYKGGPPDSPSIIFDYGVLYKCPANVSCSQ